MVWFIIYHSQLRVFSCLAYNHVRDDKLESMTKEYIFLGYAYEVKGYRLWCSDSKSSKLIVTRYMTFNEFVSLENQNKKTITKLNPGVKEQLELDVQSNGPESKVQVLNQEGDNAPDQQQLIVLR